MKTLLENCQTRLRSQLDYIRRSDIYITEDVRLIRNQGSYPAIGLKDGGIQFGYLAGIQDEDTLQLTAAVYVSLQKQEAMIIGTVGQPGVLAIAADIVTALKDYTFDDTYETALPLSMGASEILIEDKSAIMMVPVLMQFTRIPE
jgi:hypothetical protein